MGDVKRKIQAGKLRPVLVEDTDPQVVLYVKLKWKRFREFAQALAGLSELEIVDPAAAFLAEALVDWKGVEGEDGEPLPYSAAALDELDPSDVMAFFGAVMSIGEAGSGDPLPVTVTPDTTEEPPAS